MRISLDDAIAKYGKIENGVWADELKWCSLYLPPQELKWVNSANSAPVLHIYANKEMIPFLDAALRNVVQRGLIDELESFDGCFMLRDVRAEPGKLSTHCYALAIDINAKTNVLSKDPSMSTDLVKCFTDVGFSWGGDFHRKDGMHMSFAWE